jgi:hypothetical protein
MNLGGNGYVFKFRLGLDSVPAARDVIRGGTFVSGQLQKSIRSPQAGSTSGFRKVLLH